MADKDTNVPNKNDFISREAAIERFCNVYCGCSPEECGFKIQQDGAEECAAVRALKETPAADVRPVVRAFWVGKMEGVGICSNCKRLDHIDPLATHCRYCGADMREPNLDTTKGDNHD